MVRRMCNLCWECSSRNLHCSIKRCEPAIVDTRVLGAAVRIQGETIQALGSYEADVRPTVNAVTRANRAPRPNAIMQMAEDSCDRDFSRLDQALAYAQRREHVENFKKLAGLDIRSINARPSIIDLT